MAALLLSFAGAAAGGALFGSFGALAGRLAGALAGNALDHALFGGRSRHVEGPRLADLDIMTSSEGAPVPRAYGRVRLSGQVIWATRLEEVVSTETETTGGKGGGGVTVTTTTYSYFANFAVGLCEGPIGGVLRVWADGKPLDLTGLTMRVHAGDAAQPADPLIVAKQGEDDTPAYRGLAYVVFERLPLRNFGNRIPQLSFEIVRPVGLLERMVRAVVLIPGTTEFGYEPACVTRTLGPGQSAPENRHVMHAASDVVASLDELQALCPALARVAIVVAWFGDDLRAGACRIAPRVDNATKETFGATWQVAGVVRGEATVVSFVDGGPAYGGTPSDESVTHLISELKARGLEVTLYPFVMMDVPADNALPDPWSDADAQPPYPWRGRITCDPAPGRPDSPDGTAAAAEQVEAFFTGGADDWNYRNMVLHYANLAVAAGGVDGFLVGSELRGLTRVRSASGVYPAVDALVALAAEVKAILGEDCVVTYGADWTEYGAHVVDAEASEIRFPLDALWASSAIGAVGIDYYVPLADWRDGADHLDRAVSETIHDRAYLAGNLARGEGYDFYYADAEARAAQERTPITDGLGKPWIHRVKDLWNWWSNPHHERVAGSELPSPTAWVPGSKPLWLTEVGCPAVDKGANQPNVFPDPKSSESGVPYFSDGSRDDLIQRRYIEAVLASFDPAFGASDITNPPSSSYAGRMVDPANTYLWAWDARPYPVFPAALDVWSDGPNWETGHWLTGRLGTTPLDGLLPALLDDCGVDGCDASALGQGPDGYLVDRPMSPRAMIEPLSLAFAFDATEADGELHFRPRGGAPVAELSEDGIVLSERGPSYRLVRAQETELPREVSFGFTDANADYRRAAARSRRLVVGAERLLHADLAAVMADSEAQRRADIWLQSLWAGRDGTEFTVPYSRLGFMPGDVIELAVGGRQRLVEIHEIVDAEARRVKAQTVEPAVFDLPLSPARRPSPEHPAAIGPAHACILDLPTVTDEEPPVLARAAVFADPWPGAVAVWRSYDGTSFERIAVAAMPATVGETLDDLPAGPVSRWDRANRVRVRLYGGSLASVTDGAVLDAANAAAIRRPDGAWEILQFANADLVGDRTYELSRLLRGQLGSEWAMEDVLPAGASFVVLNEALVTIARGLEPLGRTMELRLVAIDRDHGDTTAAGLEATPQTTALKPLAPVHLRARRTPSGIDLAWTRRKRGRVPASWAVAVPLGEEVEAYEVDILSGETVVRTLTAATPTVLYPAAAEVADFGGPQSSVAIRVHQLSATVGRGFPGSAILTV